jgi:hypothetical protein
MVKVYQGTEDEFYMDGYLQTNLNTAKTVIRKDWDMVFAVDGAEGSGKSVFTQQMAKYCDPTFELNRVVFTPSAFRKAICDAKPYQAVVYDEAYTGLSSRATMSMINRTLISMLAEIRQRNLFVFVVMPCFFDLDKYVALWRSRVLVHVYTGRDFERGYFSFYNVDKKKALYMLGKKYYSYSKPQANFIGRFTNHYTVDEAGYKKKKRESLIEREKKKEQAAIQKEMDGAMFERVMAMDDKVPHKFKMQLLAMPPSTYFLKTKQWKEMQELDAQ